MNFVYLIGNGFDISLGFKTRFSDFFAYILKDKEKVVNNEIYTKIENDLKSEINNWADFETEIGIYTQSLSKKDSRKFLENLHEVSEDLHEYLIQEQWEVDKIFEEDFSKNIKDTILNFYKGTDELSEDIIKKQIESTTNTNSEVNFISFNYTNTLEKILSNVKEKNFSDNFNIFKSSRTQISNKILNIHGTLEKGIVLGVNDTEQFNCEIFNEDTYDEIIKPKMINYRRSKDYDLAMDKIKYSDIIIIYGMSISKTDKIWWQKIAEVLINNPHKILVIHVYEDVPTRYTTTYRIKKHREILYNNFIESLEGKLTSIELTKENINTLKEQIHFVINSEHMFNLEHKKTNINF